MKSNLICELIKEYDGKNNNSLSTFLLNAKATYSISLLSIKKHDPIMGLIPKT